MNPPVRIALCMLVAGALVACGDDVLEDDPSGSSGAGASAGQGAGGPGGSGAGGQGASGAAGGAGGAGASGAAGGGGAGGAGGGGLDDLDDLLNRLRNDLDGTLLAESREDGWPVPTNAGHVVVLEGTGGLDAVAGDFDAWAGTPLTADQGFSYAVVNATPGDGYKLTDGNVYVPDPWARSYVYDEFGELSLIEPSAAHLDRHLRVGDASNVERTVRIWIPAATPTHVLYMQDGQNLFDPNAFFGGWKVQDAAAPGMMIVGVDNTSDRFDEYTHVVDDIGGGRLGGEGDAYAAFLVGPVRSLVQTHYGEPSKRGVLGSSLGGLISLHVALENPADFVFAGSMSGTLGWGSIGLENETMIDRYAALSSQPFTIYIDSGGSGTCVDSDGDGIDDDGNDNDNYCVTLQMQEVLVAAGYQNGVDLFHWHESGAPHNEAAWASRVDMPIDIFAGL